jgi:hypothetical protein
MIFTIFQLQKGSLKAMSGRKSESPDPVQYVPGSHKLQATDAASPAKDDSNENVAANADIMCTDDRSGRIQSHEKQEYQEIQDFHEHNGRFDEIIFIVELMNDWSCLRIVPGSSF